MYIPAAKTRTAVCALGVVAALAGLVVLTSNQSSSPAQGAEARTYVFTTEVLPSAASKSAQEATQVDSLGELDSQVAGPAVIVVDEGSAEQLPAGSLKRYANKGYALVGVNVPIDKLSSLADFSSEIGAIDPRFEESPPVPATFKGDFFTVVWRTPAGARTEQWSRVQQDLTPGLFNAVMADMKLRAAGLERDEDGRLVPIEEYGVD